MALAKDKGRIGKYGGGVLKVLAVTDAGPAGTEEDSDWLDLGYVEMTDHQDDTEFESIQDETGDEIATLEGDRTLKLTFTAMQSDKDLIDFLTNTVRGQFYSVYWYSGVLDGNHEEYVYGICRIRPKVALTTGTRRPPIEITVLGNDAAINYDAADTGGANAELPVGSYATGVAAITIAAGEFYHIESTVVV